ncbi:MAG: flagellar motor switch protein FliM [Elusimicrobiota bacterium]
MVATFDARQTILSKKKKEFLKKIYIEFSSALEKTLLSYISLPIHVSIKDINYFSYENYQKGTEGSFLWNLFAIEPVGTLGLLKIQNNLVLVALDRILGGPGKLSAEKKEQLSLIELKMSEALVNQILNRLNAVLETYGECSFHAQAMAQNNKDLKFLSADDPVIVVSFETSFGELQGKMDVCFPVTFLDPILATVDKQDQQSFGNLSDPKIAHIVKEKMGPLLVPVCAYLGELKLPLEELLALEPGHVICLGPIHKDLVVKVANVPVFLGSPGVSNENLAVQVRVEVPCKK